MTDKYRIFYIEDDTSMQQLVQLLLGEDFEVEAFGSAEACLLRLTEKQPDIFLMDILLPDMNGYALCKQLKGDSATAAIPVIFISSQDTPETQFQCYEAGGDDYIQKPFHVAGLLQKINFVRRVLDENSRLNSQVAESGQFTSFLFSNMGESANLVQFLRAMTSAEEAGQVSDAMLQFLESYQLEGAVQIRLGGREYTQSHGGRDRPLEVSVMNHMRGMGRIFEFKQRAVFNYDHISVLVNNMPLDDSDRCGRIRDGLLIAEEAAEDKLKALQVAEKLNALEMAEINRRNQRGISEALEHIYNIINTLGANQQQQKTQGDVIIRGLEDDLLNAYMHLGLTDRQENYLGDIIMGRMEQLVELFNRGAQTQDLLGKLGDNLRRLVDA